MLYHPLPYALESFQRLRFIRFDFFGSNHVDRYSVGHLRERPDSPNESRRQKLVDLDLNFEKELRFEARLSPQQWFFRHVDNRCPSLGVDFAS